MQTTSKQLILTLAVIAVSLLFINSGVLAQEEPEQPPKPPKDPSSNLEEKALEEITVSGTVESLKGKMTTWMYGTHLLVNTSDETRYALKSDQVNLSRYNDKEVTLKGLLVHEGLDTGPALVKVEQAILKDVQENPNGVKVSYVPDKESLMTVGSFLAVSIVGGLLLLKLTNE